MKHHIIKAITAIFAVGTFLFAGCAGTQPLYSGPALPSDQIIFFYLEGNFLKAFDGKPYTQNPMLALRYAITAGEHTVVLAGGYQYVRNGAYAGGERLSHPVALKLTARPGHYYALHTIPDASNSAVKASAYILEIQNGERRRGAPLSTWPTVSREVPVSL